jgi:hypothetical protein
MRHWIDRTNSHASLCCGNQRVFLGQHIVKTACRVRLGDGIRSAFRRAKKQRKTTLLRLAIRKNAECAF